MQNSSKSTSAGGSRWLKCISTQGNIRGVALEASDLIQEMAQTHGVKGQAIQRFGEAIMGSLLLASYCKDKEKINLNVQGAGQVKQALVDAHPDGTVRGYIVERPADFSVELASEDQGPWGEGLLSVLRSKMKEGEQPFIGTVPLLTGHLAKDLTFYWLQSEQVPSAVGLAVNREGERVTSAAGFLVQALPGASADEVQAIESHIQEIQSLAESVGRDSEPLSLLSQIFQSTAFVLLEERPLRFECSCSWERVRRALVLVGTIELQNMLREDDGAMVRCDFCAKEYQVDSDTLRTMIAQGSES